MSRDSRPTSHSRPTPRRLIPAALIPGLATAAFVLGACSGDSSAPDPDPSGSSVIPSDPAVRADFARSLRMGLRQVSDEKLDCMIEELADTLSDADAAEFTETLATGARPPRPILTIVSEAAVGCQVGESI